VATSGKSCISVLLWCFILISKFLTNVDVRLLHLNKPVSQSVTCAVRIDTTNLVYKYVAVMSIVSGYPV